MNQATTRFPLPGLAHPAASIAWRHGGPVAAAELLAAAERLAQRLPERTYQINLCQDRYLFLTGLLAAMLRGQALLLPPGRARGELLELARRHPALYCLNDGAADCGELDLVRISDEPVGHNATALPPSVAGQQPAAELYTSGSTGTASAHAKDWATFLRGAQLTGERLGLERLRGASLLATVPPQHMYGLEMSIFLPLQWGLTVSAERPLFAADIAAALEQMPAPRILVTTPLQLRHCVVEQAALPPLAFILSATAPLERELARQAEARFGAPVLEVFGSTETGAVASRAPAKEADWHQFPGVAVEYREGRWWLSAPHLPAAVPLNDEIRPLGDDRFKLLGRDSDLIKIAGKRASLADLNRKLLAIEGVEDGVFLLPEKVNGSTLRLACLVQAPALEEQQITAALRQQIDPAFLPRPLCRVTALPRNDTGKLPRRELLRLLDACGRMEPPA